MLTLFLLIIVNFSSYLSLGLCIMCLYWCVHAMTWVWQSEQLYGGSSFLPPYMGYGCWTQVIRFYTTSALLAEPSHSPWNNYFYFFSSSFYSFLGETKRVVNIFWGCRCIYFRSISYPVILNLFPHSYPKSKKHWNIVVSDLLLWDPWQSS